ncbi:M56 family metallopeptidase [Ulvibacterium sp.]|uniref:M56 family metallopeptidase n=1 Tax=Ulvibacterium sp. TaxID=2665914 RepID=UPI002620D9F4|nr:M56 family metallopeptidase [Ulvibacterium sp.]
MIQYVLECVAFQLVFLAIYDFWLKRETFFQWNRVYLIGTYLLSLILPWVKIEAFRTGMPTAFQGYPEFLWNLNNTAPTVVGGKGPTSGIPWEFVLLFGGMILTTVFFVYKLFQIYKLKRLGKVHYFNEFTRVVLPNSTVAFSFFRAIFLGDKVIEREHETIIKHELVHIRQGHSYDLMFFELMRIVGWFNPLVYVYQNKVSELHEFIADAEVAKTNKNEQYKLLLSQVFQTQSFSFINQFFKESLVKKRIVMLQKSRSKQIWKLKYLLLMPLVLIMLFYTSCENERKNGIEETIAVADIQNLTEMEEKKVFSRLIDLAEGFRDWELHVEDGNSTIHFSRPENEESYISDPEGKPIKAEMRIETDVADLDLDFFRGNSKTSSEYDPDRALPFREVEQVPIFSGCESEADKRACFNSKLQRHISKHFNYPKEAIEKEIEGRVNAMFTIDEDGKIVHIKTKGPDQLLENEVERIIGRIPDMVPGNHGGKDVNVMYSIPITFKL